jgi:hypothetical protein
MTQNISARDPREEILRAFEMFDEEGRGKGEDQPERSEKGSEEAGRGSGRGRVDGYD